MTQIAYRLDRNLDGSGDIYIQIPRDMDSAALEELSAEIGEDVGPGDDVFLVHLYPDQVGKYRAAAAASRIPDPAQDN
jgi:hypothetical protein